MTTVASAPTTPVPGFMDVLSAERRKLLALRLHPIGIVLILAVSVGVGCS